MLTLAERNLHFCQAFLVDKEYQRDDGLAGILGRLLEFADLFALQEQFAVAFGIMVGVRTETVLGDVHLLDVHLSVLHGAVRVHQRSFALTDRLDLRAEELNTRGVAVEDDILKPRALILDPYVALVPHLPCPYLGFDRRLTVG